MQVNVRFSVWFDYWAGAVYAILMISVFDFKDILIFFFFNAKLVNDISAVFMQFGV